MIKFNQPTNLNGTELRDELNAGGVAISDAPNAVSIDGNQDFWLDIKAADKTKAETIVAAHNGTVIAPDNSAAKASGLAKLAALGFTDAEIAAW